MYVSPMTRYYLCRLLSEREDIDALLKTPSGQRSYPSSQSAENPHPLTVDSLLEHLINLVHLSDRQTSELELLVNLHQKIKDRQSTEPQHLHDLETKLFALLGLREAPPKNSDSVDQIDEGDQMNREVFVSLFESESAIAASHIPSPTAMPTLEEYLQYFQKISQITQTYLGTMLVNNYWLVTRPSHHWLQSFNVATASLEMSQPTASQVLKQKHLTIEEKSLLESWLVEFVARCSRILPPLPRLLTAAGIPEAMVLQIYHT